MTISNEYPLLMKRMKKYENYFWDEEFITLINQRICPYCNDTLTVTSLLKTCGCSFYLLGAPETLAYRKISEKAPKHNYNYDSGNTSLVCEECGCSDLKKDPSHAELTCPECGLVIQGPPAYASYVKISYDSFKGVIKS